MTSRIAISENRVREDRVSSSITKVMSSLEWCTNSANNVSGIIWVVQNPGTIKINKVESSTQHIHEQVKMQGSKMKLPFIAVYV